MLKLIERIKAMRFSPLWTAPTLIFLACFFSFGLLLSNLGFFQDDWHHVYYGYHEGLTGLKAFFYTDSRPLAYGLYGLLFQLLGFDPAHWHWFLMLLRFLTALAFWWAVRQLWPGEHELTIWLALFFALHPVYTLQPLSVAYSLHWVSYLEVVLSFALMLFATREKGKWSWLFTGLALALQAHHLLMMEYYSGLEIVRFLVLWSALPDAPIAKRIQKTFRLWLPYLVILILYVGYRVSYSYLFGYDRFESGLLGWLTASPFSTLTSLLQNMLKDSIYILISPWYTAIMPSVFDLGRASTWYMLGGSLFFAATFFFILSRLNVSRQSEKPDQLPLRLLSAGFFALILSMLPLWLVGFEVSEKNPLWSSRLALPAMLGASMFTVGVAYFFIQQPGRRNLMLSILLGVAINSQIQTARDFKTAWEKQLQFYWQLYWRAPALQPGTFIVADAEILPYMGDSPTAYAINLIYPKTTQPTKVDYWFNPGSANIHMLPFEQGQPLEITKYSSTFTASSSQVLALTFEPQQGQCLWLLRPSYHEIRFLTEEAYTWMAFSDISRAMPNTNAAPPVAIFGHEPARTWCYYYQKADLAAQLKDWPQVIGLWQTAQAQAYQPAVSVELLPFIEAFARTSDLEQAQELTFRASTLSPRMPNLLCSIWQTFEKDGLLTPENAPTFTRIKNRLNCQE